MKPAFLSLFAILSLLATGQPNITIGEVFNFNVGDEFHKHHTSWGDMGHTHETVKKVTYNADSSSVTYEIEVLVWSGKKGYVPTTRVSTYDDLDSNIGFLLGKDAFVNAPNRYFLRHDKTDSLYLEQDTIYEFIDTLTFRDSCGRLSFKYRRWEENILDAGALHHVYAVGIGQVFTYRFDGHGTWGSGYNKVFWKNGNDSCGFYDPLYVKTKMPLKTKLTHFPNPTNAQKGIFLTISENSQVWLTNTAGQVVGNHYFETMNDKSVHIPTDELPNGIYILNIQSEQSLSHTSLKVVVQ